MSNDGFLIGLLHRTFESPLSGQHKYFVGMIPVSSIGTRQPNMPPSDSHPMMADVSGDDDDDNDGPCVDVAPFFAFYSIHIRLQ